MLLNKKILLAITPVFMTSVAAYLIYEIFHTRAVYQKDFDDSIETSMKILGPALTTSIYNLENFNAARSVKGIFNNSNIVRALVYSEDKIFFAGVDLNKEKQLVELKSSETFDTYLKNSHSIKNYDIKTEKNFRIFEISKDKRVYLLPLWSNYVNGDKDSLNGIFLINASTKNLNDRILFMIIRLIIGLSISILIAIIFTYGYLKTHIIKPISKLMTASLDVSNGKFTRLTLKPKLKKDEIYLLSQNFNYMVDKIEQNLKFIRSIAEGSQEIVKAVSFEEINSVFLKYAKKLFHSEEAYIWVNKKGQPTRDSTLLMRISDNNELQPNSQFLQMMTKTREVQEFREDNDMSLRKGMLVPLINGREILIGFIELYFKDLQFVFAEEVKRLANNAAVAITTSIENIWRVEEGKDLANMERDLELASAVQDSIISKKFPENIHCEISTFYKTTSQCGGDWFGTYDLGADRLLVLFGDVTGHGTPAALITAVARGAADMLKNFIISPNIDPATLPSIALKYINDCVVDTGRNTYFMTMVAAVVDFSAHKIFVSSAGHTPPALISIVNTDNSKAQYVNAKGGSRLGYESHSEYESQSIDFKPSQQVLFYTDGIIEGENKIGKEYGLKKFKKSIEKHGNLYPEDFIKKIMADAYSYFEDVPPKDDIALLSIRFLSEHEIQSKRIEQKKLVTERTAA